MAEIRPTFELLRAQLTHETDLDDDQKAAGMQIIADLEAKCIRLIQIQDEMNKLKDEAGYTDEYSGKKHPGLRDEVERQFIIFNLFDGVKIEDFDVTLQVGKAPDRVDPIELLRQGVTDAQIKAATKEGKGWTTIRCQRRKTQEDKHA